MMNKKLTELLKIQKEKRLEEIKAIDLLIGFDTLYIKMEIQNAGYECRITRENAGMTMRDLARLADVSVSTIHQFETGKNIRPGTRDKILKALESC